MTKISLNEINFQLYIKSYRALLTWIYFWRN